MSFSLDTRNVKYLPDYAAALRHHDDIKPIRGSTRFPEHYCRPIAERRKQHFNIRTEGVGGHLAKVVVRLYSTDIVTYTPDNRVTLYMGNRNSISTRAAIQAVAGVTIVQQYGCSWVQDYDHKHYLFENGMQLEVQGYRTLKVLDPLYPDIHKLNRKAMNQKLHQFKDYYNYMLGVAKVDGWRDNAYPPEGSLNALTNPDNYVDGVFAPEPEAAFALSCAIISSPVYSGSNSYWQFFHPMSRYDTTPTFNLEHAISTALKRALIMTFRDTLLTKTKATDGRITKDPYKWAV
jgi:hypothetical protein